MTPTPREVEQSAASLFRHYAVAHMCTFAPKSARSSTHEQAAEAVSPCTIPTMIHRHSMRACHAWPTPGAAWEDHIAARQPSRGRQRQATREGRAAWPKLPHLQSSNLVSASWAQIYLECGHYILPTRATRARIKVISNNDSFSQHTCMYRTTDSSADEP